MDVGAIVNIVSSANSPVSFLLLLSLQFPHLTFSFTFLPLHFIFPSFFYPFILLFSFFPLLLVVLPLLFTFLSMFVIPFSQILLVSSFPISKN